MPQAEVVAEQSVGARAVEANRVATEVRVVVEATVVEVRAVVVAQGCQENANIPAQKLLFLLF